MTVSSMQQLLQECLTLPRVPADAVLAYENKTGVLTESVDEQLRAHPALNELIGGGRLAMMEDNHRNHAAFMKTVMKLHLPELLARLLPWIFRTYSHHGFSYAYFPAELVAWKESVNRHLPAEHAGEIQPWYDWLCEQAEQAEAIAAIPVEIASEQPNPLAEVLERFLSVLLAGDYQACLSIAREHTGTVEDRVAFYMSVLQPTMYRIGTLWEQGEISVAQEHLCASMVGRIMAVIYEPRQADRNGQAHAVVTCAWNEHHELGAWMLADMLAMDGWEVRYLGANTPNRDLLDMVTDSRPSLLAVSVSMPYNLDRVKALIDEVREVDALQDLVIMVGGQAFGWMPNLWKRLGADALAVSAAEATVKARRLVPVS